jgi:hypothetical protein
LGSGFIDRRINCFKGVFRTAIMLAIYMGFKKIYLVGFDYTHQKAKSKHWYERGHGVEVAFNPIQYELDFINIAKEFIEIETITLEGGSDIFPSVTYKDFTGRIPVFRENNELTRHRYLKAIAMRSPYDIF